MDNGLLVLLLLVAGAVILWLWSRLSSLRQEVARSQSEVVRVTRRIQQDAMAQFQAWRLTEIETVKQQQSEVAGREAQVSLAQWKVTSESGIRADAIQRSLSVTVGKVTEHVVPYLPDFSYNPKDARFIGSPVDFVVFDGLSDGAVEQIVFIEVKTGASSLSKRERQVREAVLAKNITWKEIRVQPPGGSGPPPIAPTDTNYQFANQDDVEAVARFRASAELGDAVAQFNLGWSYAHGRGVEKDDAEAVKWFRKAADQGEPDACYSLGEAYDHGEGVQEDPTQAVRWFRVAAQQGDDDAQYCLGFAYRVGRGVARDEAQAVQWFRKAAQQGHVEAQRELGVD